MAHIMGAVPFPPSRDASRRTMPAVLPVRSIGPAALRSQQVLMLACRPAFNSCLSASCDNARLGPAVQTAMVCDPHGSMAAMEDLMRSMCPGAEEARTAGQFGMSVTSADEIAISGLQVSGNTVSQRGDEDLCGKWKSLALSPGALRNIVAGLQDESTLLADVDISGLQISGCTRASMMDSTRLPGLSFLQASGLAQASPGALCELMKILKYPLRQSASERGTVAAVRCK
jgi:hypothetical protein